MNCGNLPQTAAIPIVVISVLDEEASALALGATVVFDETGKKEVLSAGAGAPCLRRPDPAVGKAMRRVLIVDDKAGAVS